MAEQIPVAWRIAGGRRRYNAQRRRARDERRTRIAELVLQAERPCVAVTGWGLRPQLARSFGVHPSVMSRDFAAIGETLVLPDPCCAECVRRREEARLSRAREREDLRVTLTRAYGRILPPEAIERIVGGRE